MAEEEEVLAVGDERPKFPLESMLTAAIPAFVGLIIGTLTWLLTSTPTPWYVIVLCGIGGASVLTVLADPIFWLFTRRRLLR